MSCAISRARRLSRDRTFVPANDICRYYSVRSPCYTDIKSMFTGKPSARRRRQWAVIAAIAVGSVISTLSLGNLKFFQLVHLKARDLHFLIRGKRPTSNVVIIRIDQYSLDHIKDVMMFWHPHFAK